MNEAYPLYLHNLLKRRNVDKTILVVVEVSEVCLHWKDQAELGLRQRPSFLLHDFHYTAFQITCILSLMSDTASLSTCAPFNVK